jgi:hypothetical protein
MTFDHCKPDPMDYNRDLPIVILTPDARWEPAENYDDHGHIHTLGANCSTSTVGVVSMTWDTIFPRSVEAFAAELFTIHGKLVAFFNSVP